jgi:hypothetical protein
MVDFGTQHDAAGETARVRQDLGNELGLEGDPMPFVVRCPDDFKFAGVTQTDPGLVIVAHLVIERIEDIEVHYSFRGNIFGACRNSRWGVSHLDLRSETVIAAEVTSMTGMLVNFSNCRTRSV